MVQFHQLYLVCIAGYCLKYSFKSHVKRPSDVAQWYTCSANTYLKENSEIDQIFSVPPSERRQELQTVARWRNVNADVAAIRWRRLVRVDAGVKAQRGQFVTVRTVQLELGACRYKVNNPRIFIGRLLWVGNNFF